MKDEQSYTRTTCRLCESTFLETVVELPDTPLANQYLDDPSSSATQQLFPLFLCQCKKCNHLQLPVTVNPELLFKEYLYVSGTSNSFRQHLADYARKVVLSHALSKDDLVVEIGSNDGTLLQEFKIRGHHVVGIDPAEQIASDASDRGIFTICSFFNDEACKTIENKFGKAGLVIANNVFAHIDDLRSVMMRIKSILTPETGVFIFEVQYGLILLKHTLFDMIYHEHLCYHTVEPLISFFASLGMTLTDVESVPTHGGSIRVTVVDGQHKPQSKSVQEFVLGEKVFFSQFKYSDYSARISRIKADFGNAISRYSRLVGYGAPAKLTTLSYTLGINANDICYVVDDNPLKQNKYTPGTGIPILASSELDRESPSETGVILFAWNFASQLIPNLSKFKGNRVIPLPEVSVL